MLVNCSINNLLHKVLKLLLQSFIVQSSAFHKAKVSETMIWYEPNFRNYNLLNLFSFYLLCLVCRKNLFSFSFNLLKILSLHVHLVLANAMRKYAHHLLKKTVGQPCNNISHDLSFITKQNLWLNIITWYNIYFHLEILISRGLIF